VFCLFGAFVLFVDKRNGQGLRLKTFEKLFWFAVMAFVVNVPFLIMITLAVDQNQWAAPVFMSSVFLFPAVVFLVLL
ncbi:MAG: hypothetical protein RLZZ324_976, partial [Candidatus Parcubacteria bacterium]